ncbi:MAG: bifunctional riboflavin kinase/FAD synthetase [Nitriliruptorales bacterium]|nr:bifunctional riboflavin kinase/FAD synthetase [Nitriliruptorales bacterium]
MTEPVRVARSIDEVPAAPSVVTIGVFDGVHRGHQSIIGQATSAARDAGVRSVAVTFDRHPIEIVRPGTVPKYLQTLDSKVTALLAERIDLVYVIEFTHEFSQRSALDFIDHTLCGPIDAKQVVVGANFRFGNGAEGDVGMLATEGATHGFDVAAVTLLEEAGTAISSTVIRERVLAGEVEWAGRALGRPHVLEGPVVKGNERGRTIGFPTANVEVDDRMCIPADGVYAGHATVVGDGTIWQAAISIGTNPTFGGTRRTVEAYVLDADLDVYGAHMALSFEHRIRGQVTFDGVDSLVAAIEDDVARTRSLLGA